MYVSEVRLRDFRNYAELQQSLRPGLNLLIGENAQGKTNLLEAICVAAAGSSPRTSQDSQLIRWDQPAAAVRMRIERKTRDPLELEIQLRRGEARRIRINGVARRRVSDLIGLANVVVFMASDLEIVKGEPAARRKFLDRELGGLSRSYHWHLGRYRRVLEQRNDALRQQRDGRAGEGALATWDEQLARYGGQLIDKRRRFVEALHSLAPAHYAAQAGEDRRLVIRYHPALNENIPAPQDAAESMAAIKQSLLSWRGEEIRRGVTLVGPHRDDLSLWVGDVDLRLFGSQGEQRTAAIALRLGLRDLVEQTAGEPPILLLDDVLSELDQRRRHGLLEAVSRSDQMIMTGTDLAAIEPETRPGAYVLRVADGAVSEVAEHACCPGG
jgi:DNA replication and repair protein RecF